MSFPTNANATNNFGVAQLIVDPVAGKGTHTTITNATTTAVSGQTIFIRPGTYTENVTMKAGVNYTAFTCDAFTPNVTIKGTLTMNTAGTCSISGIRLQTNSAAFLAVTGSAASIVNLFDCYLNASNNNGITFSSSSGSAVINIDNCYGDLGSNTTYFAHTSGGTINFNSFLCSNSGAATTASTCSAGNIVFRDSFIPFPITTSSSGVITADYTSFNCGSINATALTCGGGTSNVIFCEFAGGTASAISTSVTLGIHDCIINSSNTNAITGAGTLVYSGLFFPGTSVKINTTTQTGGTIKGGVAQAPSTGFIGEVIQSTATSVATTSTSSTTIASVALTPGVWDISALASSVPTGGTGLITVQQTTISTTDNAVTGTLGIETFQTNTVAAGATTLSGVVPGYPVTITSNTTYYLVVTNFYSSTTCPTNGRISARRVG